LQGKGGLVTISVIGGHPWPVYKFISPDCNLSRPPNLISAR